MGIEAIIELGRWRSGRCVVCAVGRTASTGTRTRVKLPVHDIRIGEERPGHQRHAATGPVVVSLWEAVVIVLDVHGQAKGYLLDIAQTGGLPCFLSSPCENGEQDCCQDRDDRDHHEQFDKCEAFSCAHVPHLLYLAGNTLYTRLLQKLPLLRERARIGSHVNPFAAHDYSLVDVYIMP